MLDTRRAIFTLADTAWRNITPADFASMGAIARTAVPTDRFRTIKIDSIADQNVSICYGPRTGSADDGTRGMIGVPAPDRLGLGKAVNLTFKNLTIVLVNDGEGDSGTRIDLHGLTLTQLRDKMVALITAANTGIAGLVAAAGPTDDLIILQADAGEADTPEWGQRARNRGGWAHGMTAATALPLEVGAAPFIKTLEVEETSVISIRAAAPGATIAIEIETRPHGSPVVH